MSNDFTIRVRVSGTQDIEAIKRSLRDMGATVTTTTKQTRELDAASRDLNRTQNQGVAGTANATKSFSKMAQTMNSGNLGIVGAYATLAANIFAVTAAFGALRNAAQVEQIFRGLEAAGTRAGLSLNSTAKALKEVSGAAISTEQAMRSTAVIVSAGFKGDTVERLGQAARDTSFALGRNMTDSLDRLTRGIVKLEPELLDELGLMTKITESSTIYARELGKSSAQLTNFEKRQGFANAILAEAELKFGGLSEAAGDATAFDRLAATFSDLSISVLNFVNIAAKPLASLLASSPTALLGALVLFGSTLKSQLVPGFLSAAAAQKELGAEARKAATAEVAKATKIRSSGVAAREATLSQAKAYNNLTGVVDRVPAKYKEVRDAIKAGTGSIEEQNAAVKRGLDSLKRSQELREGQLGGLTDPAAIERKKAGIEAIKAEIESVKNLARERKTSNIASEDEIKQIKDAKRASVAATLGARARDSAASAIESAASLGDSNSIGEFASKVKTSYTDLSASVVSYARSQATAAGGTITGMGRMRVAIFATANAARVLGTAFLSIMPYLGLIIAGIGILQGAFNSLKSKELLNFEKATTELADVLSKANEYGQELVRTSESLAAPSQRAAQAVTIQSNAISEATAKLEEYIKTSAKYSQGSFFDFDGAEEKLGKVSGLLGAIFGGAKADLSYKLDIAQGTKALDVTAALQEKFKKEKGPDAYYFTGAAESINKAGQALNTLEQTAGPAFDAIIKREGGIDKFTKSLSELKTPEEALKKVVGFLKEVNEQVGSNAQKVAELQESFKNLDNSIADFSRASVQTTPFDGVVKSGQDAITKLESLKETVSSTQFAQFATGLGAQVNSILTSDTSKQLEAFIAADATVQKLNAQKALGEKIDTKALAAAQQTLEAQKDIGEAVQAQLGPFQQLFRDAQVKTRLLQGQASLLAAQMQSSANIYKLGGAGRAAQIRDEEKSRALQVAMLQVQINIQKRLVAQAETKIALLNIELQDLEVLKLRVAEKKKEADIDASQVRLKLSAQSGITSAQIESADRGNLTKDFSALGNSAAETTLKLYDQYNIKRIAFEKASAKVDSVSATTQASILAIKREVQDQLDGIKNLENQIAALNIQNLTSEQKRVQLIAAQAALNQDTLTLISETVTKADALKEVYSDIYALENGVVNRLDYQLLLMGNQNALAIKNLNLAKEQKKLIFDQAEREIRAELTIAGLSKDKVDAAKGALQTIENRRTVDELNYQIELDTLKATNQKAVLEKVMFDTRKEGLNYQKTALSYSEQILDNERELVDAANKKSQLERELKAKRNGYEITAQGLQASEIDSARTAYELAVKESQIKMTLIDLEFALLDAERANLVLELESRRAGLSGLNNNGQNNTQLAQLDATLANIGNVDLSKIAAAKKDVLKANIENLGLELQKANTIAFGGGSKVLGALEGMMDLLRASRRASNTNPTPISVVSAVVDNRPLKTAEELKRELEANDKVKNPTLASNTAALLNLAEVINKWIVSNPTQTVNAGNIVNSYGKSSKINSVVSAASELGVTPTELAGILHKESSLNPKAVGRVTKGKYAGNEFHGLFQADAENRAKYGINKDTPFEEQMLALLKYAKDRGFKAGMGWKRLYTTINAGNPNAGNPRDINGSQQDHYRSIETSGFAAARNFLETKPINVPKTKISKIATAAQQSSVEAEGVTVIGNARRSSLLEVGELDLKIKELTTTDFDIPEPRMDWTDKVKIQIGAVTLRTQEFIDKLKELGPQGELVAAIAEGMSSIGLAATNAISVFETSGSRMSKIIADINAKFITKTEKDQEISVAKAKDFASKFEAVAQVAQAALSLIQSATAASAKVKIDAIDKEIAAEQKRDGKSAESVAKIAAFEKRKDEIGRKQFNTNKKLMMAQAIIATATGVTQALALGPPGIPLAVAIGVLGAAQLAIIAGTSYQSTNASNKSISTPSQLTIGKRGDTVDLANQNNNVGGEIGYLRGNQGTGSNSRNYQVVGSAYGGDLPRGYGNTAYVVGEKGPETIAPLMPMTIKPSNDNYKGNNVSASISINAIDARGLEEVLQGQRGNIISMLREASNANGSPFMEDVNVNVYTRPNNASRL